MVDTSIRDKVISIHAPTRGATVQRGLIIKINQFQSTLLQEERHRFPRLRNGQSLFQSTLLQEERQENT